MPIYTSLALPIFFVDFVFACRARSIVLSNESIIMVF